MSNILIFGDSITFGAWDEEGGWVDRIRKEVAKSNYKKNFDPCYGVFNLGIPGNTSKDLLLRFDSEVKVRLDEEENIIVIAIGINDSQVIISKKQHKISEEDFVSNIQSLIQRGHEFTSKLIFIGLTSIDDNRALKADWLVDCEYKNEYSKKYNEFLKRETQKQHIQFVDIYSEFVKQMNQVDLFINDGIHPNSTGHKLLYELILPHLSIVYEDSKSPTQPFGLG